MARFRLVEFNANSIRTRLEITLNWLREHEPTALCIQGNAVVDSDFPVDAFAEIGYELAEFVGQKWLKRGGGGIWREEPKEVTVGMGFEGFDEEARLIRARICGVNVVNGYFPRGPDRLAAVCV